MKSTIGRQVFRWALRMALLYAFKKGVEIAKRRAAAPQIPPRARSASELPSIH